MPVLLLEHCRKATVPVTVVAFKGHARPEDFTHADTKVSWHRLGGGAAILGRLADEGVSDVVLAGSVRRPGFFELLPDPWSLWLLLGTSALWRGDDGLLRVLVKALEQRGIRVVGIADVAPDMLTPEGTLTTIRPDDVSRRDLVIAVEAARRHGIRDLGQAAVVRAGEVVALEGRGGTDAMLRELSPNRGAGPVGVLVKCVKPQQDHRTDLPTIGPDTVVHAVRAGLVGIAVDAGASIIVDRGATLDAAEAAGLFVVGLADGGTRRTKSA